MSTSAGQSGQFDKIESAQPPNGYKMITEGTAHMLCVEDNEVFYNKVQVINRDISALVIKTFDATRRKEHEQKWAKKRVPAPEIEKIKILEALSATGLRAIRYWKEIPNIDHIVANDLLPDAVEAIRRNVEFNGIDANSVRANLGDATEVLYTHRTTEKQFHVVDLDPYGSAAIFLDGAVQAVTDGGLLCITCTDMLVLAGKQATTCFSKYGGYPLSLKSCHEQALRILLGAIQNSASRYKRRIEPLISLSIDFYVRVFVRVHYSPAEVKKINGSYSHVLQCDGCDALQFEPVGKAYVDNSDKTKGMRTSLGGSCPECGGSYRIGGPIWSAPIHNPSFIEQCLEHLNANEHHFNTVKRMKGLLTVASKEIPNAPLYYDYGALCAKIKCASPPLISVRSAIVNAGYEVSQTHAKSSGLKTNAPVSLLFDIFRTWTKDHPSKLSGTDTPAGRLLSKPITHQINFDKREEADLSAKHTKVPVFLPNPEENWGPGKRAKGKKRAIDDKNAEQQEAKVAKLDTETHQD